MSNYHFGGYATRVGLKCSDGRIIMKDAFKHHDGETVPLVWNHMHNEPENVLGHAVLRNREDGVYAECTFNNSDKGQHVKGLVENGDIRALSIWANQLTQKGPNVQHGIIREVSVVLAGANPGAYIDTVMRHGVDVEDEAVICAYQMIDLCHSDDESEEDVAEEVPTTEDAKTDEGESENLEHAAAEDSTKTLEEVYETFTDEQKLAMYGIIGQMLDEENQNEDSEGGNDNMKHNVFDKETGAEAKVLSHSEFAEFIADAKRCGSMKEAALSHGIDQMQFLFPEEHTLNNVPTFISGDMTWVKKVMSGVHKSPFSKIRALFADITPDAARAKGYIKGKQKKEEVFALLKRTTSPQTIYKLQKMDRDDIIDITTMDVVAFIKGEMRIKLEEEIARAVLIGDGRLPDAEEKIKEEHIRPIWTDEELYAIHSLVEVKKGAKMADIAAEFIDQAVRAREDYDGSGSPTAYVAENLLSACLLLKDATGRRLYKDVKELATAMMVSEIVTVPHMKGASRTDSDGKTRNLLGIIVNLNDYTIGADKGGAVTMFDDFDIDYNKYAYLIETRCSGSLLKPKSGIVLEMFAPAAG